MDCSQSHAAMWNHSRCHLLWQHSSRLEQPFCQHWQPLLTAFLLWDPSGFPPALHTHKPQELSQKQDFTAVGLCHGNSTTNSRFVPYRQSQLIVWLLSRDDVKEDCTWQSGSSGRNTGQPPRHQMSGAVLLCQKIINAGTSARGWRGCLSSPEVLHFQIALRWVRDDWSRMSGKGAFSAHSQDSWELIKLTPFAEGQISSSCLSHQGEQVFLSFALLTWHTTSLHMQGALLSPRALFACQVSNPLPSTTV